MDASAGGPWDYCFLDGPPAFLTVIEEMITAADFVLIPVKPSMLDLLASEDALSLARQAGAAYRVVFNDVGPKEKIVDKAREFLFTHDVLMLDTAIVHRTAHINAMTVGKSAAEVASDDKAAKEIDALWAEIKALAAKAAKARARKEAAHG